MRFTPGAGAAHFGVGLHGPHQAMPIEVVEVRYPVADDELVLPTTEAHRQRSGSAHKRADQSISTNRGRPELVAAGPIFTAVIENCCKPLPVARSMSLVMPRQISSSSLRSPGWIRALGRTWSVVVAAHRGSVVASAVRMSTRFCCRSPLRPHEEMLTSRLI